jgi:hypothetical protein
VPFEPSFAYGGSLTVSVTEAAPFRFTLVRLGATTHGFDQDQRFVELGFIATGGGQYVVHGPTNPAEAPPGYYMLFALSRAGQPSVGRYVRVGGTP